MRRRDELTPRMKQMLPSTATSPVEDQLIMGFDFKSQIFQASFRIPSYVRWFNHEADLVPTFRYVKRVLKLLQWRCPPNRWRLKNPTYSLFVEALDQVFPDARYCMTHRDIANVIPSVADLYFEMGKIVTDMPDKVWMGEVTADSFELGMRRMIAFRDAGNEARFFDINFAPFQRDPFPVLERLYAFLGEEFTDEARARMQAWRRGQPARQARPPRVRRGRLRTEHRGAARAVPVLYRTVRGTARQGLRTTAPAIGVLGDAQRPQRRRQSVEQMQPAPLRIA